ncbi:hypothetical protein OG216_43795 [Streptomycetaceae bacterium NBC_01309]
MDELSANPLPSAAARSHAEDRLVRPYGYAVPVLPPERPEPTVRRWVPFTPNATRWVVAWGSCHAYAMAAHRFADDYAADRGYVVVGHVLSDSPHVRDALLFGLAEASAIVRARSYGLAWWMLGTETLAELRPNDRASAQRSPCGPPVVNVGDWVAQRPGVEPSRLPGEVVQVVRRHDLPAATLHVREGGGGMPYVVQASDVVKIPPPANQPNT